MHRDQARRRARCSGRDWAGSVPMTRPPEPADELGHVARDPGAGDRGQIRMGGIFGLLAGRGRARRTAGRRRSIPPRARAGTKSATVRAARTRNRAERSGDAHLAICRAGLGRSNPERIPAIRVSSIVAPCSSRRMKRDPEMTLRSSGAAITPSRSSVARGSLLRRLFGHRRTRGRADTDPGRPVILPSVGRSV